MKDKEIQEHKVINKFLIWYESLTMPERIVFQGVLGRIINALPKTKDRS